jgi:hypothetical protein
MNTQLIQAILSWIAIVFLISPLATATPVYGDNTTSDRRSLDPFQIFALPYINPPGMPCPHLSLQSYSNLKFLPKTELNCGNFSTADWRDIAILVEHMNNGDPDDCTTPARTCRRLGCRQTSGIYVSSSLLSDASDTRPH